MKISRAHLKLLGNSLIGLLKKCKYNFSSIPSLSDHSIKGKNEIIISLTSYGRRVRKTVFYTIVSLFKQSMKPNKIVLWLDKDNWNEQNIPKKLSKLQEKGLEIRFCKDIRSYKKLIPTLKLYPNSIIVTVDDDVLYSEKLLETLYNQHLKYPRDIICTRGYKAVIINGQPEKYKTWKTITSESDFKKNEVLFPVGIGGILYPPNSLHPDVLDEDKFLKLCPNADDIWFWYMAKLNETKHQFVSLPNNFFSFDAIYQALHRGSALTHSNVTENHNDVQLKNVLTQYDFKI